MVIFNMIRYVLPIVAVLFCASTSAIAATKTKKKFANSPYYRAGKAAFVRKDYNKAIKFFRSHLLKFNKDYDSWNYLAVSYYHAGLPKRTLKYLRYVSSRTDLKSLNYLYRGLALLSLGRKTSAIKMLRKSSKSRGNYQHAAVYELALIYYHNKDFVNAKKWCRLYLSEHKTKAHAAEAKQMCRSIDTGTYIVKLEGIEKPKLTSTKFKYNILSLFNFPHFWIMQVGNEVYRFDGFKPGPAGSGLINHINVVTNIYSNFGLGLGAFRMEALSFWLSYIYSQKYNTEPRRLQIYLEDWQDISYFPYRFDLLMREHRVASGFTARFGKRFNLGVYNDLNISYIGSSFVTDPEGRSSLKGKVNTKSSLLTLPWMGISIFDPLATYLYAYFEITTREDTNFSSKTYSFNPADFNIGFGVRNIVDLKDLKTKLQLDFYYLPYLHNDYWLDFLRLGGALELNTRLFKFLRLSSRYVFLFDQFALESIKDSSNDSSKQTNQELDPYAHQSKCDARRDLIHSFEAGSGIDFSSTKRLFLLGVISLTRSCLPEYSRKEMKIMVNFSWAFPSAERSLNYVNKFTDTVYLIGREDYGYVR